MTITIQSSWHPSWEKALLQETKKPYFLELLKKIHEAYSSDKNIYPEKNALFHALSLCSFENVKVVIVGQDPYHRQGQAHGLAFSVQEGINLPPSLKNILKEMSDDLGCTIPTHGDLSFWAKQGVLLLNASLTVEEGRPNAHADWGWHPFTDHIIHLLNAHDEPIVFLLWGSFAQKKSSLINNPKHCILKAPHPSPLSAYRGFFGSKPFSQANAFLIKYGRKPIQWY
jgi:uracil-DNA glycosylase